MLAFFEKKLALLLVLLAVPLLFLPKINLIGVESETAGIRIDDLVLLFIAGLIFLAHLLPRRELNKFEVSVGLLTVFSIVSFLANRLLVYDHILFLDAKITYAVRIFEYFTFFYVGYFATQTISIHRVIQLFFAWNVCVMLLQKFSLIGGLTVDGYNAVVAERVQGIASFPSEMGLILNLLFCYFVFDEDNRSKFVQIFPPAFRSLLRSSYVYIMFSIFGMFVIFTGNRISILALIICFLFKLKQSINWRSVATMIFLPTIMAGIIGGCIYLIINTESVYERSMSLFSFKNFELAQIVWDRLDLRIDPLEDEVVSSKNYDASWWIRIHKWIYAMKAYATNPECYLQGLGPGTTWSALDGGFLRIFVEYGLIGTMLFIRFFSQLYRINMQLKWMMVAFFFNMIFFDAYLAYKSMSLLLFTAGGLYAMEVAKQKMENTEFRIQKPELLPQTR